MLSARNAARAICAAATRLKEAAPARGESWGRLHRMRRGYSHPILLD
jgi:hypothetical protein